MNNRRVLGQEAIEFVLISILVFLSALLVVFLFGNKIASFFTHQSSAVNAATVGSRAIDPLTGQKYNIPIDETPTTGADGVMTDPTQTTGATNSANLNNLNITDNADGSTSFTAGGKKITLNTEIKDKINQAMQTTAGSANTEIIKEIATLISQYQKENPGQPLPAVNLDFGNSDVSENSQNYNGTATSITSTTIKVGSLFVVIQKDSQCGAVNNCNLYPKKQRKFEGKTTGVSGIENGYVSYYDESSSKYKDPISLESTSTINIADNLLNSINANYKTNSGTTSNVANLNFGNTSNHYQVSQ